MKGINEKRLEGNVSEGKVLKMRNPLVYLDAAGKREKILILFIYLFIFSQKEKTDHNSSSELD